MDGEIYHHGILGQKWGVRRYQNKDGSLTAAGKQRQKKESGSNKLSNEELQKRISRLQIEETYSQLLARQKERNRSGFGKFLSKKLGSLLDQSADAAIRTLINNATAQKKTDVTKWLDKDVKSIDPSVFSEVAKWYENAGKITQGQKKLGMKPTGE